MKQHSRVCAYIDLGAVRKNVKGISEKISTNAKIIAVIKTDGYGHGAIPIAKELEQMECIFGYAVATTEEALSLRKEEIKKPILILGYVFPQDYEELIDNDVRFALFRRDQLEELATAAKSMGKPAKVHIKVDTAMSRIGIFPDDDGLEFVKSAVNSPGVETEGMFTHFARADEEDKSAANKQFAEFSSFIGRVKSECPGAITYFHAANSAAIMEMPDTHLDLVRAGIILYGIMPSDEMKKESLALYPVLSLKSHVVFVKEIPAGRSVSYGGTFTAEHSMKVATIPVGYGDGYPRSLSNKGTVLIGGKRAKILGRVCMDQFMVDVTDMDVNNGDEVTLLGKDGGDEISIQELGDLSGRFPYELACDLTARVPRVYL